MTREVVVDGAQGEGGGQILRTSLALSLITRRPVRFHRVRARRARPGLARQHLAAVRAAAAVGDADVEGATLGSTELRFAPRALRGGEHRFDVGSAGSTTLVLETVLPALLAADRPSALVLEGGTHNPLAPPYDFVERAFLPLLRRMGARVEARLVRRGFEPAGGGRVEARVEPSTLAPLALLERGAIRARTARVLVAGLPEHVAERERAVLDERLGASWRVEVERDVDAAGPGIVVLLAVEAEHVTEVFAAFGRRGIRAESVAHAAVDEAAAWLGDDVPVGPHLADQLLLPLALAGGGAFRTLAPTPHTTTNVEVIRAFLPDRAPTVDVRGATATVRVP